ncbi:MAG: LacI family DNA-binding transcriptional regulator [Burkholderiaceae bacterium]|nr:LacI family DNA-binding transcriptional regulator [Burkholderiaceae bacterium]
MAVGTVSRVLGGYENVAPGIREKVRKTIEQVGFVPNAIAQSMRLGATRTIGLIVYDITVPALAAFVKSVQRECQDAGYVVLLANTGGDRSVEFGMLKTFAQRQTDGLIVTFGSEGDPDLSAALTETGIPIVLFERDTPAEFDRILADHEGGMYAATRHLLDIGHRRIALITGSPQIAAARSRLAGFRNAYSRAKLPFDEAIALSGGFSAAYGYEQAKLLLRDPNPPSAILAGGLSMLPGVLRAIDERGVRVPEQLSLIGIADAPLAEFLRPPIAAIRWDFVELGRLAAQLLLTRIDGSADAAARRLVLPTEFISRESCAPPQRRAR